MIPLTIERWHSAYRTHHGLLPQTIAEWEDGLRHIDLGREIDALIGSEELVFIRTLHLQTRLDEQLSPAAVVQAWRSALLRALCQTLEAQDTADSVRYRDRRAAIADLLYRSCCGDDSRMWVAQQMELVRAGASGLQLQAALVQDMLSEPMQIWPILGQLLLAEEHCGAFTALLEGLAPTSLLQLLEACPQTRDYLQVLEFGQHPYTPIPLRMTPLLQAMGRWALTHTWLMPRHYDLLLLIAAAAAASDGGRSLAREGSSNWRGRVLAAVDLWLNRIAQGGQASRSSGARSGVLATASAERQPSAPGDDLALAPGTADSSSAGELPAAPALPVVAEHLPTDWAGLLFLLNVLPAGRWRERLHALTDGEEMPVDAMPAFLWTLATRCLLIPGSDPAVRAWCGDWQPAGGQIGADGWLQVPDAVQRLAQATAEELLRHLTQMLGDAEISLRQLCHRPGLLYIEPGWIELHLPLREADTRLRRAALDLDPGWISWLGCVVRFIYA